jgi:Xaa-Pro aminopeptidase
METQEKLKIIRDKMRELNISAYIVLSSDPHKSEYLPEYWQVRKWISGFTGSCGDLVISEDDACLWTDSRYFIQAEDQLKGTGIRLQKMREPSYPTLSEWLYENMPKGSSIGVNGSTLSVEYYNTINNLISKKDISIETNIDLIDNMWTDRPSLFKSEIFSLDLKYSGVSRKEKIKTIQNLMEKKNASYHFLSALDEISWTLNIRSNDVDYTPVVISYLLITSNSTILFANESNISSELRKELNSDNIEILDYSKADKYLEGIEKDSTFLLDPKNTSYYYYNLINTNHTIVEEDNPSLCLKSIKNETEISGSKKTHFKDGIALSKFWYWLEQNIDKSLTELDLEDKLLELRSEEDLFVTNSFGTIVAYGPNAALPHYSASKESNRTIENKGLLLIDSGGQYLDGTTDITRTMSVGETTYDEKFDYTHVLKGMINLSTLIFPEGTRGCNIDLAARQALWRVGRNYGHGTGHGVGSFLNVHEGPQSVRQEINNYGIYSNMVMSNEPGCYIQDKYGIRHENLILTVPHQTTDFGRFLKFETLSLCYIDTKPILKEFLTEEEIEWLNSYNENVYESLNKHLEPEIASWLREKTLAI